MMIRKCLVFFAFGIGIAHAQSNTTNIPTYPETQLYSFPGRWTAPQTFVGGINLSGSLSLGTGTLTAQSGYFTGQLWDTQTVDTYIYTGNGRNIINATTLNPSQNTTTVWEGDDSFITLNGPGQQTGEVNGFHSYFQINAGAYANQYENFEASALNNGTINNADSFLSQFINGSAGTVAGYIIGLAIELQNNNTTAGSIANYVGLYFPQMSGSGSLPTDYWAMQVVDPNASISTVGGVHIGSLTTKPAGTFEVDGPDASSGTYLFALKNNAATNLLLINDAGQTYTANGSGGLAQGANCSGTPSSSFASINGFVTHC